MAIATEVNRLPRATTSCRIAVLIAAKHSAESPPAISDRFPAAPRHANGLAGTWLSLKGQPTSRPSQGVPINYAALARRMTDSLLLRACVQL